MSKPGRKRTIGAEKYLAQRLAHERRVKGWSYETLAGEMKKVGCSVYPGSLQRMEKGDPPQRVKVDELVGFSNVFEIPLDELILPVKYVLDLEGRKKVDRWGSAELTLQEAQAGRDNAWEAVIEHLDANPDSEPAMTAAMADYYRTLGEGENADSIARGQIEEARDPKWSLSPRQRSIRRHPSSARDRGK